MLAHLIAFPELVPRFRKLKLMISGLERGDIKQLFDPFSALTDSSLALFDSHRHIITQKSVRESSKLFQVDVHSHSSTLKLKLTII